MAGNGLWLIRILQSVMLRHIRRITGHYMAGGCSKDLNRLLYVSIHYMHPILQIIEKHTSSRHISALSLDLQSGKGSTLCPCFQQDRNDSRSSSQIHDPFSRLYFCKSGEQHRIHSKTKTARILNDPVAVSLKLIQTLSWF